MLLYSDTSTSQLLTVIDEMNSQYNATLENLRLINDSVTSMMNVINNMHTVLSTQLDWLIGQLGGAQDGLAVLTTLVTHAAFLLMAILCVLFVKAPGLTRLSLLVMVSTNALMEIKYRVSLTFVAMTIAQVVIMSGELCVMENVTNWFISILLNLEGHWIYLWFKCRRLSHSVLSQSIPALLPEPDAPCDDSELEHAPETITHTPLKQQTLATSPSVVFESVQCAAKTRTGLQCKLPAIDGARLCRRHVKYC